MSSSGAPENDQHKCGAPYLSSDWFSGAKYCTNVVRASGISFSNRYSTALGPASKVYATCRAHLCEKCLGWCGTDKPIVPQCDQDHY